MPGYGLIVQIEALAVDDVDRFATRSVARSVKLGSSGHCRYYCVLHIVSVLCSCCQLLVTDLGMMM